MFGTIGMQELLIVGGIALLIFGPRQLPKLGRMAGETIRELRGATKDLQDISKERIDL